jgi:thiol-disulfide isomerase/thioredoxin
MKKLLLSLSVCTILFSACKEKAPYVRLTPEPPKSEIFYILSPVPAAEQHNVLVEDFTGASCPNCPAAHETLEQIVEAQNATSKRVNVISLYITNYPQTEPPHGAKMDFRDSTATEIQKNIFQSLLGMPIGGVDRRPFGASATTVYQCAPSDWSSAIQSRLSLADSINLDITSTYDAATGKAKVITKVTYLYPTTQMHNLSIAIVEDSFVDVQEDNRLPSYKDTAYHFNDIYRGMITSVPFGDVIAAAQPDKVAGFTCETTYNIDVPSRLNPANCRLIAFVHKGQTDGGVNIMQSKQTKLKP